MYFGADGANPAGIGIDHTASYSDTLGKAKLMSCFGGEGAALLTGRKIGAILSVLAERAKPSKGSNSSYLAIDAA